VVPTEPIRPVELPPVSVTDVEIGDQSVSFDVDRVGVPVLVKVSYFPNWEASGAEGPYRIGPNMMVVVPTDTSVELTYGRSLIDHVSVLLTLVGIGLCVWWRREGDLDFDGTPSEAGAMPVAADDRDDRAVGEEVELDDDASVVAAGGVHVDVVAAGDEGDAVPDRRHGSDGDRGREPEGR
jgi:hypothetical protein